MGIILGTRINDANAIEPCKFTWPEGDYYSINYIDSEYVGTFKHEDWVFKHIDNIKNVELVDGKINVKVQPYKSNTTVSELIKSYDFGKQSFNNCVLEPICQEIVEFLKAYYIFKDPVYWYSSVGIGGLFVRSIYFEERDKEKDSKSWYRIDISQYKLYCECVDILPQCSRTLVYTYCSVGKDERGYDEEFKELAEDLPDSIEDVFKIIIKPAHTLKTLKGVEQ